MTASAWTRRALVVSAAAALLASSAQATSGAHGPDLVEVRDGALRGVVSGDHRTFSGIPFAAPPVGDRRWRAPAPVTHWRGVRDATEPGNRCPQLSQGPPAQRVVTGSEDCLYLDVTTPAAEDDAHLPVMVWIPGGGFVTGAGSDYDPARLAVTGRVVVVTVNYRLGALGFLAHRDLGGGDVWSGNYGLADQQMALRWVRDNIEAFGGDARNVTLFGQSAGAFSVCAQLASPRAHGLFDKAIVQSGPCGNSFVSKADAEERGAETAARLGCAVSADVATCLREKPAADLVGVEDEEAFGSTGRLRDMPWTPVAGTPVLPAQPLDALRSGAAAGIPLVQGVTRDEMRPFVALDNDAQGRPVTLASYPAILRHVFGADADRVLSEYPADRYPTPGIALATVLTDWGAKLGACGAPPADTAAARYAPVYAYEFGQDDGGRIGTFPMGAAHGAELPYLFDGSFAGPRPAPSSPAQLALSRTLITYWTTFARTGDPDRGEWPEYRPGAPIPFLSSEGTRQVDFLTEHHCLFWRTVDR
ncbi:carboxylesterase family protein [Amycolatopsis cynarae]|uniref:Carboxylic ester hydrolase n=1 Tax=Amycolatopsis cynarae TaxID=2995223 RepID=A0ABY7AYR8_9PSEU|nr:carboxylesterase family protein [Amycolatopsis sp. HUAS 11-8]WAL63811.1 carboxylesterase family protein [Amycolatopsis sp. HUAS 11-8]